MQMAETPNRLDGRHITASKRRVRCRGTGGRPITGVREATEAPPTTTQTRSSTPQAPPTQPSEYDILFGSIEREMLGDDVDRLRGRDDFVDYLEETMEVEEGTEEQGPEQGVEEQGPGQGTEEVVGTGPPVSSRRVVPQHPSRREVAQRPLSRPVVRGEGGRFEVAASTSQGATSQASTTTTQPRRRGRGRSDSWRLTGPAPGGPTIVEVIPSFGGHIAHVLWSQPDSDLGVTRIQTRYFHMSTPWVLSPAAQTLVDATGLGHLRGCMARGLNYPLLRAFVERWQPDTNTFHLPFGEMSILLHDVAQILGVPVSGRVCRVPVGYDMSPREVVAELFDLEVDEVATYKVDDQVKLTLASSGVLAEGLRRFFSTTGRDPVPDIDPVAEAHAYLLHDLGSALFVDKTGDRVSVYIYALLRELAQAGTYAWGVGTLAYLYRQLGIGSRADCRGLSGCLTLLQCWIYEYFPTLRPDPAGVRLPVQGEPRASRFVGQGLGLRSDMEDVRTYRQRLDSLTPSEVTWRPYGDTPYLDHPQTLFLGVIRYLDVSEPYQPDRCVRQLGFTQFIPSRVPRPDTEDRGTVSKLYTVSYIGDVHDAYWEHWDSHVLDTSRYVPAMPAYACFADYIDWYLPRTHPLLIDPARIGPHMARDRGQIASEAGHYVMERFRGTYRDDFVESELWQILADTHSYLRGRVLEYHGPDAPVDGVDDEQPEQPEVTPRPTGGRVGPTRGRAGRSGGPTGERAGRSGGRAQPTGGRAARSGGRAQPTGGRAGPSGWRVWPSLGRAG